MSWWGVADDDGPIDSQLSFPATAQVEATTRTVQRHQMAAPTPLRPQLLNPVNSSGPMPSTSPSNPTEGMSTQKGLPNLMLKGSVKFISATESDDRKVDWPLLRRTQRVLSTFCDCTSSQPLPSALAIPNQLRSPLDVKAEDISHHSSRPPTEILCQARTNSDSTKFIVNFMTYANTRNSTWHDLEAQTGVKTGGVTQNADIEATCWMSISKRRKKKVCTISTSTPSKSLYVEGEAPKESQRLQHRLHSGGKELRL